MVHGSSPSTPPLPGRGPPSGSVPSAEQGDGERVIGLHVVRLPFDRLPEQLLGLLVADLFVPFDPHQVDLPGRGLRRKRGQTGGPFTGRICLPFSCGRFRLTGWGPRQGGCVPFAWPRGRDRV